MPRHMILREQIHRTDGRSYVRAGYVRAHSYAMLGEKDHAIADLEWVLRVWEFDNLALWEVKDAQKLLAELKGK